VPKVDRILYQLDISFIPEWRKYQGLYDIIDPASLEPEVIEQIYA